MREEGCGSMAPMKSGEDLALDGFLAELGLAFFAAQALEYSLTSLFAATELAGRTRYPIRVDLRPIMDARYKQTLGRLTRDAAQSLGLDTETARCLETALHARNWLVHHVYAEFAPSAFSDDLRVTARNRLREARAVFEEVTERVGNLTMSRLLGTGVPPAELAQGIERATRDYVRRRLSETAPQNAE